MNKVQVFITFFVIAAFIGIIVVTQGDSINKQITQVPTLPPESSTFKLLPTDDPNAQAQPQQQGQQQVQQQTQTFGVEEGVKASYSATIKTSKGNIRVTLYGKEAPKTVRNFLDKIKSDYYNGLTFHRVEDWVIQGGDPKGNGTGGGLIATEPNTLPFVEGSLGVARGSDPRISNDSQFFITKSEASHLNQQYTNFGMVESGMNVVNNMEIGDKILGITVDK